MYHSKLLSLANTPPWLNKFIKHKMRGRKKSDDRARQTQDARDFKEQEQWRCLDNYVVFGVVTIEGEGAQKILPEIGSVDAQCYRGTPLPQTVNLFMKY